MLGARIGGALVLALACAVAWPSAQGGGAATTHPNGTLSQ